MPRVAQRAGHSVDCLASYWAECWAVLRAESSVAALVAALVEKMAAWTGAHWVDQTADWSALRWVGWMAELKVVMKVASMAGSLVVQTGQR